MSKLQPNSEMSVIIPVHNGEKTLSSCLKAIYAGTRIPGEIILIDDQSTDATAQIATSFGVHYYKTDERAFSPGARNLGISKAKGDLIVFLDADVLVQKHTLEKIERFLSANPDVDAVFGSYDNQPTAKGCVSQYRNLLHHYVHQHSNTQAHTFWTGCGAVRASVFEKVGQFTPGPDGMKDIEFGYRMYAAGYKIRLQKDILVTHLKHWTFFSMLRTDILLRAIPWSLLLIRHPYFSDDLNLRREDRWAAVFTWLALICGLAASFFPWAAAGTLTGWLILGWLKADLWQFFFRQGGHRLILCAFFLYQLYLIYSSASFGLVMVFDRLSRIIKSDNTNSNRNR